MKFGASRLEDYDPGLEPELKPYDRWILSSFTRTAGSATSGMDEYEYATAMNRAEHFFWKILCDNYLEIAKNRLYSEDDRNGRISAQYALYRVLYGCLRLFAPVLVHVTEELYQAIFRPLEGHESVHLAPWPRPEYMDGRALETGDLSLRIIEEARRFKSENSLSMAAPLKALEISAPERILVGLRELEDDLISVSRAAGIFWKESSRLEVDVTPDENTPGS